MPGAVSSPGQLRSEAHSEAELNNPRKVVLAGDLAEGPSLGNWTTNTCVWGSEWGVVEEVEELPPEFKPKPAIRAEPRVLEGGEIDILDSIRTKVWFRARI